MDAVLKTTRHDPPQWQRRGESVYLEGRAHLDGVDALAVEMERKWGVDRLRLLVDPEWRLKFDNQRVKLNRAIHRGDLDDVKEQAQRMCNAWRKLDQLATDSHAQVLSPQIMEVTLNSGMVVAIVRDVSEAHAVSGDGRKRQVWTVEEIARCIEAFPEVVKAKEVFPGATVVATRMPLDPLDNLSTDLNDDLSDIPY